MQNPSVSIPTLCGVSVSILMLMLLFIPMNAISSEGSDDAFCNFLQTPHHRVQNNYNACLFAMCLVLVIQECSSKIYPLKLLRIIIVIVGVVSAIGSSTDNYSSFHSVCIILTWLCLASLFSIVAVQTFQNANCILVWLLLPALCGIFHFLINLKKPRYRNFQNRQISFYAVAVPLMAAAIMYTSFYRI